MIAGTGIAATMPASGMASAVAVSAQRSKYIFAVALAHNRIDVSADMITEMFDVRPHTARRLLLKLVKNGVVDAPNAQGIARLAEQLQRIAPQVVEYNPAGGYIVNGQFDELSAKAKEIAKNVLKADSDETDMIGPEPEDEFEGAIDSDPEDPSQTRDLQG